MKRSAPGSLRWQHLCIGMVLHVLLSWPAVTRGAGKDAEATSALSLPQNEVQIFVIPGIEIGASLQTSQRDLLIRIIEELPHDILKQQNLEYYDPSAAIDLSQWNPRDLHPARRHPDIIKALSSKSVRWMLLLSLSLAPGGPDEKRMLMSGRLIDIPKMQTLITEANKQAEENRKSDHDLTEAERHASVDLRDFVELRPSLRSLFARLFELPEIGVVPESPTEFNVNEILSVRYDVQSNRKVTQLRQSPDARKDAEDEWAGAPDNDAYQVRANLYELTGVPESVREEVCRNPRLNLLRSRQPGSSMFMYVGHARVERTVISPQTTWLRPASHGRGTVEVQFQHQNAAHFLLATSIFRFIPKGTYSALSVPSEPAAVCVRLRETPLTIGIATRFSYAVPEGPAAVGIGGELSFLGQGRFAAANLGRVSVLPAVALGPVVGVDYRFAATGLVTTDLSMRLATILVRLANVEVVAYGETGFGARWREQVPEDETNWNGYVTFGGGLLFRIGMSLPLGPSIGVAYLERRRWSALPGNTNLGSETEPSRLIAMHFGFAFPVFQRSRASD